MGKKFSRLLLLSLLLLLFVKLGNGYPYHQKNISITYPQKRRIRWKFGGLYNRVQGFFPYGGPILESPPPWEFNISFNVGYGFAHHRWSSKLRLERRLLNWWSIYLEGYDEIFSQDSWLLSTRENTLSSILIREDFMDYYRRRGGLFCFGFKPKGWVDLELGYRMERERNSPGKADWSLFKRDKSFRENPTIEEGLLRSGILKIKVNRVTDEQDPPQGWQLLAGYQGGGGDFSFSRYRLEFELYQRVSIREEIDLRLKAVAVTGADPPQQFFLDLGGIGSLRGCRFKEFSDGERLFLANLEYRFSYGGWFEPAGIWFLENLQIILFFDSGLVWSSGEEFRPDKLKSDVGLGLSGGNRDDFRLNFAWRLDKGDNFRVGLRLQRIF